MSPTPEIRPREPSLGMGIPRRIVVKGREGATATVTVTTYRGEVWMFIVPSFTTEAIMEIRKVDELIHALGLAREEAIRSVTAGRTPADRGNNDVVREIRRPLGELHSEPDDQAG